MQDLSEFHRGTCLAAVFEIALPRTRPMKAAGRAGNFESDRGTIQTPGNLLHNRGVQWPVAPHLRIRQTHGWRTAQAAAPTGESGRARQPLTILRGYIAH